jgi:hypothetical protein
MADDPLDANYALLAHPSEPRILLLQDGPAWTLPRLASWEAREIRAELRERLALDTTVLRSVYFRARADDEEPAHVTALESHTPDWTPPPSARWIGRAELDTLPLAVPEHRAAIAAALSEAETGEVPAQRPPWARPGWLPLATAWVEQRLSALGDTLSGPIEQMHAREWSTVLRAPTTRGPLYFKAEAPYAAFEPGLTDELAHLVPDSVARVLATDPDRAYMLTEHAGTAARDVAIVGRDLETWEALLPQFAALQQATVPHLDLLLAKGCPDLRLAVLPDQYAALLADTDMLLVGQPGGLTAAEYDAACAFTPEVAPLCAALSAFGLPETVHHDDFHLGNMLARDGHFVFIDWAEGAVTHPFCSLVITLRVAKLLRRSGDDTLARMRDIYLATWADFAPLPCLVEAFILAQRLALLLRALTWRDAVSHMEPNARLQYGDSPAYWLRLFLTAQTWIPNADAAYTI